MGVEKGHEPYDFLRQESESMASEYNRIRDRAPEDPGTVVKDAKKYATTGGRGFQVWAADDPTKRQVPDLAHSAEACFVCHTPQKAQEYTFSSYIP